MIYSNDPTKREIRRRTGRTGYFDEDWHGFSGDVVDTITGKMKNYSELLRKKTDTWATMSKGQLDERVATFQDFGLTNMREGYVERKLNEASNLRENATGDLDFSVPATRVTNLGQAQANRNQRVQGYLTAKRKLKSAQDLTDETGSSFKFNKTGYERLNPNIDSNYREFDEMIDERKQAYAQAYGMDSFDDFVEGFGMFATRTEIQNLGQGDWTDPLGRAVNIQNMTPEQAELLGYTQTYADEEVEVADSSAVGQQDIMNMILSDITGMSYDDITYASTAELGYTREISQDMLALSGEQDMDLVTNLGEGGIDHLRQIYGSYFYTAASGADKAADQEDAFRIASAAKAKRDEAVNQRRIAQESEEGTAEALRDINRGIRAAEAEYEESKSALLGGGTPSQRKARAVTFKDARPQ